MTTSAYNLGNKGLASKILRTEDLTRAARAAASSVCEIEADFCWFGDVGAGLGLAVFGAVPSFLVGRFRIVPTWHV